MDFSAQQRKERATRIGEFRFTISRRVVDSSEYRRFQDLHPSSEATFITTSAFILALRDSPLEMAEETSERAELCERGEELRG